MFLTLRSRKKREDLMKVSNGMIKRAFVLLSGGIDSTTCLALAMEDFDGGVEAVSIDYGQRHIKEAQQAKAIADYYGIQHTILKVSGLAGEGVMLTDKDVAIPSVPYSQIQGVSPTYVPFRNGNLLSAVTAHAQKYVNQQILGLAEREKITMAVATDSAKDLCGVYFGAHSEDALNWAYPDCTPEFVGSMANAIYIGTYFAVRLYAPFVGATKADIISTGTRFNVPYGLTWSCYKGDDLHCGICPTCRARKSAFEAVGIEDPTLYAEDTEETEDTEENKDDNR
jgi:7-cyano-7-deazaguanine synthase